MYIEDKLDSGIPVVCEQVPDFHSVTVGIWVRAGSVTETEKENGLSHLIEHMLFKERRSAAPNRLPWRWTAWADR